MRSAGPALAAAAFAWTTCALVPVASATLATALVGSASLFAYELDVEEAGAWRRSAAGILWLAIALVAGASCMAPFAAATSAIFPLAVVAYARRDSSDSARSGLPRANEVPLVKPLFVALFWALIPVYVTLFARAVAWSRLAVGAWSAFIFVSMFALTTLCDFRDIEDDVRRGVKSWPVVLGQGRTRCALHVANTLGLLLMSASVALDVLPRSFFAFELLGGSSVLSLLVLARAERDAGDFASSSDAAAFTAHVLVDLGLPLVAVASSVLVSV